MPSVRKTIIKLPDFDWEGTVDSTDFQARQYVGGGGADGTEPGGLNSYGEYDISDAAFLWFYAESDGFTYGNFVGPPTWFQWVYINNQEAVIWASADPVGVYTPEDEWTKFHGSANTSPYILDIHPAAGKLISTGGATSPGPIAYKIPSMLYSEVASPFRKIRISTRDAAVANQTKWINMHIEKHKVMK